MPARISLRDPCRAPATDAPTVSAEATSDRSRPASPSVATGLSFISVHLDLSVPLDVGVSLGAQGDRRRIGLLLILGGALGGDLGGAEGAAGQRAFDDHLGAILESVGHGARVANLDVLAAVDRLELVLDLLMFLVHALHDRL